MFRYTDPAWLDDQDGAASFIEVGQNIKSMITPFLETTISLFISHTIATIGLLLVFAFLGSKILKRVGVPRVISFILIGVIIGPSFLNLISLERSENLRLISEIAMGLIGFDIGSQLHWNELRKQGKTILWSFIFESLGSFFLVSAGIYLVSQSMPTALIFGAISTATAPAVTAGVLVEYKSRGPLTTSILATVGLDGIIALLLYSLTSTLAVTMIENTTSLSLFDILKVPAFQIGGAVILGIVAGVILAKIMDMLSQPIDMLVISLGVILLSAGVAVTFNLSLILSCMILGMVAVNRNPILERNLRYTVEQTSPIIYLLFFVLVGARFQISLLPTMGILGIVYIILRSTGKIFGALLGGIFGGAQGLVRKNLGFGLLSQGAVALSLAIDASNKFPNLGNHGAFIGALVINAITATTFILQIIGPLSVKFAIRRAGEIGKATDKI